MWLVGAARTWEVVKMAIFQQGIFRRRRSANAVRQNLTLLQMLQSLSRNAGIAVTAIGGLVMVGWLFDVSMLKSVLPGLVTMKTNTALGFVLGGLSLWLWTSIQSQDDQAPIPSRKNLYPIIYTSSALVLLIGLLTLVQYYFDSNLGIDELLFKEATDAVGTYAPNRMAPNSALNFLFLGWAQLLLLSRERRNYILAQVLTLVAFLVAFLGFLGYAYGITSFYGIGSYTQMALHTAIAFVLQSLGMLLASPDRGLMAVVVKNHAGSIMARRLSPAAVAIPPILGWSILVGYRWHAYDPETGISLLTVVNIVVFAVLIWWNARALGAIDKQRDRAEVALKIANEKLEARVEQRTIELSKANEKLHREISDRQHAEVAMLETVATLEATSVKLRDKNAQLKTAMRELTATQAQLIQSEKLSSLGQLVAGVAHEINNPVNFIYGNICHIKDYGEILDRILKLYQKHCPNPAPEIQEEIEEVELDFVREDLPNVLSSIQVGADRIREIVQSLRNFSRVDEAEMKEVDIHDGIESTLMILQNRLKAKPDRPAIQVVKNYGELPSVQCYPGQLNQVFMNLLANAIDALEEDSESCTGVADKGKPRKILVSTAVDRNWVAIKIADNGPGIKKETLNHIFDPFFTTKPMGKGTGLGLAISYSIITEKHRGKLTCDSTPGNGTEFAIEIPLCQIC